MRPPTRRPNAMWQLKMLIFRPVASLRMLRWRWRKRVG